MGPRGPLGRRTSGAPGPSPTPTSSATTPPPTPTPPPSGPLGTPVVTAATPFGSGTANGPSYTGSVYYIVPGTATMPNFGSVIPFALVFTPTLNVASQPMKGGFPGPDKTRNTYFVIRYQAPLVVTTEADYDFRVVADDGAVLSIDGTTIVDIGGPHASSTEKDGPVHLIAGTHQIQVDYLQTTGNVALQVYCKQANGTEQLCPTQL
jgi:hypothetical protein